MENKLVSFPNLFLSFSNLLREILIVLFDNEAKLEHDHIDVLLKKEKIFLNYGLNLKGKRKLCTLVFKVESKYFKTNQWSMIYTFQFLDSIFDTYREVCVEQFIGMKNQLHCWTSKNLYIGFRKMKSFSLIPLYPG